MAKKRASSIEEDPILFDDLDSSEESDDPIEFAPVDREPATKDADDNHLVANDESEELEIIHELEEDKEPDAQRGEPADDQELLNLDEDLREVADKNRDLAFRLQDERNAHADLVMQQEQMVKGQRHQQLAAVENRLNELPAEITRVKTDLKKAKEEGDTDAEMEALDRFYRLRQEEGLAQLARGQLQQTVNDPVPTSRQPRQPTPGDRPVPQNQLAREFMRRNPWIEQSRYATESSRMRQIDQAMANEGLDSTKPDYYRELDRRLRVHFPNLPRQGAAARPATTARSPVAAAPRGVVASRQDSPTRVMMTRDNIENMRRFQLDPRDKKAVARYAREKYAIARAEKARGK